MTGGCRLAADRRSRRSKTPGVTSAVPLIEQPLMATANGRVEGVLVRGMRIDDIRANKTITRQRALPATSEVGHPGQRQRRDRLAACRNAWAYPGSQITLWNPEGRSTVVGTVPRDVTYTVGAIFEVGVYDYDKAFVLLPMQDAQELLLMGDQVGMIEVQTTNPDKVQEILAPLQPLVQGKAVITDWRQMNSALFQALEVERVAMFVVLSLIVLVAVFNILSSLIMLVRAKTRDIAILRTMGASRRGMMKVFVTVGVTIGSLGIILGLILGAIFLFFRQGVVNAIQTVTGQNLWDPSVRFLTELPSQDRSVRGHGDRADRPDPIIPRDALSGVQGGEHRSRCRCCAMSEAVLATRDLKRSFTQGDVTIEVLRGVDLAGAARRDRRAARTVGVGQIDIAAGGRSARGRVRGFDPARRRGSRQARR